MAKGMQSELQLEDGFVLVELGTVRPGEKFYGTLMRQ